MYNPYLLVSFSLYFASAIVSMAATLLRLLPARSAAVEHLYVCMYACMYARIHSRERAFGCTRLAVTAKTPTQSQRIMGGGLQVGRDPVATGFGADINQLFHRRSDERRIRAQKDVPVGMADQIPFNRPADMVLQV